MLNEIKIKNHEKIAKLIETNVLDGKLQYKNMEILLIELAE